MMTDDGVAGVAFAASFARQVWDWMRDGHGYPDEDQLDSCVEEAETVAIDLLESMRRIRQRRIGAGGPGPFTALWPGQVDAVRCLEELAELLGAAPWTETKTKLIELFRRAERAEGRARVACQILINEFGCGPDPGGPQNVERAAENAAAHHRAQVSNLMRENQEIRKTHASLATMVEEKGKSDHRAVAMANKIAQIQQSHDESCSCRLCGDRELRELLEQIGIEQRR